MENYDIIIIGGGPGGYETALYAKENGFSVLLIEKNQLGGTCLNCGCIPTKTYNAVSKELNELKKMASHGINVDYSFNFEKTKERKDAVISELRNGISFLLKKCGVDVINGHGTLTGKNTVSVDDTTYTGKYIIIATGSRNLDTIIKGSHYALDSTKLLDIDKVPENLAIIGGGVIGVEMATIFNEFGSNVTIFEGMDTILPNLDREITRRLSSYLTRSGIKVNTKTKVLEIKNGSVVVEKNGSEEELSFDKVLLSIGRIPNTSSLGLDEVGIEYTKRGIQTNDVFQTNISNIYAIGDVNGKIMLAHYAEHSGKVVIDSLLGNEVKTYPCPGAIFSLPELATVGVTEEELKEKGSTYIAKKMMYRSNGKALAMDEAEGFVKVLIENDMLVGCHIIGYDASTLIHEAVVLMNSGTKVSDAKKYIYAHPTLSELFKNSL